MDVDISLTPPQLAETHFSLLKTIITMGNLRARLSPHVVQHATSWGLHNRRTSIPERKNAPRPRWKWPDRPDWESLTSRRHMRHTQTPTHWRTPSRPAQQPRWPQFLPQQPPPWPLTQMLRSAVADLLTPSCRSKMAPSMLSEVSEWIHLLQDNLSGSVMVSLMFESNK